MPPLASRLPKNRDVEKSNPADLAPASTAPAAPASTAPAAPAAAEDFVELMVNGNQMLLANPRTFNSGSVGYYCSGKVVLHGSRHQMTCSIVKIHSKPTR